MEEKNKNHESALNVQKGIEQPSQVNPALSKGLKKFKKEKPEAGTYAKGILDGDRSILGQAITLIESVKADDQEIARELINQCLPHTGNSIRLGITGVPGAGKSTFIEAFGNYLIQHGHKIAVLAIDPSSQRSKGSILGDKTRMESLSTNPDAFIRPSASSGTLGGVARATREAVILCEAAGFDLIIIETVGVGQSETAVAQIVDFFLLLMLAGGGDELQGIKRGIMEMADLIVINKADGDNEKKAGLAKREYENALHLFPPAKSGWSPTVVTASALYSRGLEKVWEIIEAYISLTKENGYFEQHRQSQSIRILHDSITQNLTSGFMEHPVVKNSLKSLESQILKNKLSPYEAAAELLQNYYRKLGKSNPER
jgi:LAO/AO transport system kinase